MDHSQPPAHAILHVGQVRVDLATGELSAGTGAIRLDARLLRLLIHLAEHPGAVVSIDQILDQVWPGVAVTPDSVYQAIASLRRALGDDPKDPSYIATVPRSGYRLIATVEFQGDDRPDSPVEAEATRPDAGEDRPPFAEPPPSRAPRTRGLRLGLAAGLAALLLAALAWVAPGKAGRRPVPPSPPSEAAPLALAVMPFEDLTQKMDEEPFADGISEELINRLSKVPGLRVTSRGASFYFKERRVTPAEIAKALKVGFLLEGSVRKSGSTLRITARLIQVDQGYVLWSETFDRPVKDLLAVQEDIADAVGRALSASVQRGGLGSV